MSDSQIREPQSLALLVPQEGNPMWAMIPRDYRFWMERVTRDMPSFLTCEADEWRFLPFREIWEPLTRPSVIYRLQSSHPILIFARGGTRVDLRGIDFPLFVEHRLPRSEDEEL